MTLPQRSLHPASGNDRGTFLGALEFVASCDLQFAEVVGTVVGHGVTFEPSPKVFDRIHVGCIGRQECNLNVPLQSVQVLAYKPTAMRPQSIPDYQQRLPQMSLEHLEKIDDLLLLDAALVESEQTVGTRQPRNDRHMVPVEVELDDGCLTFGSPGSHAGRAFADSRLVDKDGQSAFPPGFFLRAGQVLHFQERTVSSLRSMARFSGFCGLKPIAPRMRQICVWPNRTPCNRSMTVPTRLRVHSSVPKPCSVGLCKMAARIVANCPTSSWAGRPRSGTERNASIPPSSRRRFHVYRVWRATPTATATSAHPLPASSNRPALTRFFEASLNLVFATPVSSNIATGDITHEPISGCHELPKYQ